MSIQSDGPIRKVDSQSHEVEVGNEKKDPFAPDNQSLPVPSHSAVTPSKMTPDKIKVLRSHHPRLQEGGVTLAANLILKLPRGESKNHGDT